MRILVASHDPVERRGLATLLRELGHGPVIAATGEEAWRRLQETARPPLALLDWGLPGVNGPGLCARLRDCASAPYVYVIMIGEAGHTDGLRALQSGADDVLPRPLDQAALKLRIRTAEHIIALQQDLSESRQALEYKSTHDCLTGMWNRAEVLGILEREIARSLREGWPVCVIMIDVDHFKGVNDTYGHLAGDAALREVAGRLMGSLRPYDIIGRYGGEEFLLVLGGCSPRNSVTLAERLRARVAGSPIAIGEHEISLTVSMGVAAWDNSEHGDLQALLRAADAALYEAKRSGRDRIQIAWTERPLRDPAVTAA